MALSSSSPSNPAFSSESRNFDVFLSFRGEDTRRAFVDHLYSALVGQGIITYKDDVTLPRGESVHPSLKKAIEESQIALIIFSKNYADSSWCLDELTHIMNCKDTRGQTVMPIFYDVDPSEVRKQKGKYGEAFFKHELENKAKVESWKKALFDASNICGWELRNIANGNEAIAIKEIVVAITQKLQPVTSSENENLIGMEVRVPGLKSELQIESGGVRMIGIWGIGGGGKTTLASSIYNEICRQFDDCCFVQNIREESSKYGLRNIQVKILSEVLKQKQVQLRGVEEGKGSIRDSFRHRKVLLVLDDVDQLDQLGVLAGSHDWFGEGSRIIITTRDKHLLIAHKVDVIHNIRLLNDDEALKLLCKHVPRGHRRIEDYEVLSKEVVSYAGGLPLALRVVGRFLYDKEMNEWRSVLARLKEIPDSNILEKLLISFDGLGPVEKDLFLDIACFFRRWDKDDAMKKLDAFGFYPAIGVKVLIQKALITISEDGKFDMHDLVQEMGHHIVRGEHPNNPEKHSRVWKKEDVKKICAMDLTKNLDKIEAIRFRHGWADRLEHLPQIIANMKNVRWIDWEGDLASPWPANIQPMQLRCLTLNAISQKQLWESYKFLPNLRMMELYDLRNLIMTPDFDGVPNLERFKLTKCWYLEEIHPSIGRLEKLVFLSIEYCFVLKMFPPITQLKELETLTFSRCPKLFKLSKIQQPNISHIGLQFFHGNLRKLELSYCELGDEDIGYAVWGLPNLQELNLTANKFSRLNFRLMQLPRLKWLNISYCKRLVELSELPSSIDVLIADDCSSLETFGDVSNCKQLWSVSHLRGNKLGDGDILIHSMLQVNAIQDHFISVTLPHLNPEGFVSRLLRGKTFTLHLPVDWYNDFCGFLVCIVTDVKYPKVNIVIKQEVDEDSRFDHWQESDEAPEYDGTTTSVGYVSFDKLGGTTLLTSSYNMISFSIEVEEKYQSSLVRESYVGAELVPRISKGHQVQTTDLSEFREDVNPSTILMIQHDSKSSIDILWQPCNKRF